MSELLSVKDIAKKCRTTETTIYNYVRKFGLKKQKIEGRKTYYKKEVVDIIQSYRANSNARWYSDFKRINDETWKW